MNTHLDDPSNALAIGRLLKADDVAEILNISRSFVFLLIERGELPCVWVGRLARVKPSDLASYIERSTTKGEVSPS